MSDPQARRLQSEEVRAQGIVDAKLKAVAAQERSHMVSALIELVKADPTNKEAKKKLNQMLGLV